MSLLHRNFDGEYDIELEATGEGIVNEENLKGRLDDIYKEYRETHPGEPESVALRIADTLALGLDYGFTGIDSGYLERISSLKELVLPASVTQIDATPGLLALLKQNDVLIRGILDSYAEKFASEQGLHFRPADLFLASYEFEYAHEINTLSLLFCRDGSIVAEQDVSSPGSSAGNSFGGTYRNELPQEFWKHMTAEQAAEKISGGHLQEEVLRNGRLAEFMEKAKLRDIYTGNNQ